MNKVLTTNCDPTKENASLKNFSPDVESKNFTRKRLQQTRSFSTNYYLCDKINKFEFTDWKKEKKFACEYQH